MITFDIETIGSDSKEVIKKLAENIKPPAQFKKPESIKQWMDDNYDSALKEAIAKTALDGAYGQIACISLTIDGCNVISSYQDKKTSERDVISEYFNFIKKEKILNFCGHNIIGFDIPFIKHRSIILGINPPPTFLNLMNASPYDDRIKDTMLMWSRDKNKMVSLDTLCWLFDIDRGDDIDGSEVGEIWKTDPQRVINKCINDVRKTKKVYDRLTFATNDPF